MWRAENQRLDTTLADKWYSFFDAVRVCTRAGNCDLGTSLALFAKDMTVYLNDVCAFVDTGTYHKRKETEKLAKFLLDHDVDKDIFWSDDEGRKGLFGCDYLRDLSAGRVLKGRRPWLKAG